MSADNTRAALAAIARAEYAAWKKDPMPRRAPAKDKAPSQLTATATGPCGAGPADPFVLKALVDELSPVRPAPPTPGWPRESSRAVIEQLIARELDDGHVARIARVDVDRVRAVRARMDVLSA